MYGPRRLHFIDREDQDVEVIGASLGGRRVTTERHNTTLSAAGVLRLFQNGGMSLALFHNRYAALPLNPNQVRAPDVEHFVWATDGEEILPGWTKV